MVRQYAYYCGAAVVLSSGCLCLLSHSVWLLATWGVALLTTAVAAAYFSALFITAVMNEDFSCLGPQSLQFCCSSVFKKLMCRLKNFIDARVGTEIGGNKPATPVCAAVMQASLEARTPSSSQVTGTSAGQQPSPIDDGRIRGQLIDLSQRLHDQFVLPWYLCLSPDGLSHHQLCGVLEDVLLSCWQQLRVAGGLRSLLLDCCDLFSVLALAHPQRHQLPNPQKSTIGDVGPQEYDQLSMLSQLVVLRHLPPLLLTCKGLVVLLRDLLTCNFVVPLYLKLCQPCVILQHWAAISASSNGREGVEDLGESCGSRDSPHGSSLPHSRLNDLQDKSAESKPGNPEQIRGKCTGQGQSSAVSLHQKRTSSNSRSKVGLASAVSQRKMLRKILKHPNPIKIKTMFTKGVVDGMTEEDYKTCYFFNDLPRFIAPLNFHRGTYSWTHSSHKSEPGSPHHISNAELLVSRSEPCSPRHFVSRSTIQSSPGRRISWSDPTLQLKKSSCLSKEGYASSVSKLNKASIIELNETSVPDQSCYETSRGLNNINSSYDGVQETQSAVAKKYQRDHDTRSLSEIRFNSRGEDYQGKIKLKPNVSDKPFNFNNEKSELILRSPHDEMSHIRNLETKHPAENGSLKTKATAGLQANVLTAQLLRRGTAGSSKSEDRTFTSISRERHDGEALLAALTTPHSQLLVKKKKLVKMHSFDHFDGTVDPSLPPKFCSVCQVQCSTHCTHGASPAVPSVPSRLPCCLRTCRHRSGSCGEVPRRCDNFGCELPISSDNFSDGKLVISSARDFIVAPPLNEPPAQILTSSVSSSNELPSLVSFLKHPQEENKSQPLSITESLSAQLSSYPDAGVPANSGLQTCLPSGQISRSCLELDSSSRIASSSSKIETPITYANIKENLKEESGPTILSHPTESEKNLGESVHFKTNELNSLASESDEREPFHATTGEKETKARSYETSAEKPHATLEQWIDSVFESNSCAIETSGGAVGKASEPVRQGDVTKKNFVPNGDGNHLRASPDGATLVEVSAASAQASPDDGEELSPVYEEANNLESSIAKLRSLLSERHPHQSGGSGSSVGSSDSDLPPDHLTEVSPSRHSSYLSAAQKTFMSDRPMADGGLTEPLLGVEQLPCRPLEGTVEVLEGRDVPRDGRLIVSCSIPATVVERDPCGSPYTLYTVQYDALYVFDGRSSSRKRKTGRSETTSLKKIALPAESSPVTAADSEPVVKKVAATTSVHKSSVGDGKNASCDRNVTIARGSSSSSDGKGESTSRDDEAENSDDRKPRLKCANGKSNAQKYRLVLHTKSVERRFREFVSLHNALWVHPKLRFSLRGVTGPSKWRFLPHGKLDSATVSMRRLFLENYMQILLQRIDINTSSIMRQFLCYDSDSKPGEYRTPFEIDWSQIPDSLSARKVLASSAGRVASGDQILAKHQAATSLPGRAASGEAESQPKPAVGPEQRPTSLFSHDSSSSIASLSSFREPPHVSAGTDDIDEMNLVNVLDIDNCELNIALTAELQPCAMEEALFEDYMTGDAGYSPDMQNTFSDHGATVASGPANIMTSKPNLPVSSFLVPGLDVAPDKVCRGKSNLLVVSEPHCSAERTALVHPFHFSDLGNCVADSLSHALRLPLSYPDVGLLRKSVNTIKDCTFSTFSSSAPMPSTSSTSPGEPLAAYSQVSARSITESTHELSPQTSLLLTSEKLSSVNAETISLCDFSVDDSAPVVTHRRASVEGIGDAEREAFSSSRDVWNSYPRSTGIFSGLLSQSSEPDSTKHLLNRASLQNLSPYQKDNAEGEVSVNRHSKQSCRTPEESLNLHAASCSPSSTLVPESSVKRPASAFLNIFNSVQSAERPFADYIGVKYFCPNCPRVNSCIRCEGSTVPGVTLPQLTSDLDDCSWLSALAPQSGVGEKFSGRILLNTVIALLNSRQASRGKASTYVLTEPIVELIARWVVPSITAVIDHKLDQLFSEENVANFIHEILNTSNLESESNSAKRCRSEGDKFVPLLEYERFLAALGDSNSESSQPVDFDTLKELLISSLPDVVVTMGLGKELAESVLLLLQDPVFSSNLALETINLLCSHLLPQHQ